ncbi:MAG: GNAT family N-acetyltransferase [bacterium]
MHLQLSTCEIRSWQHSDIDALPRYANNRKIARNLRDGFPHPYTRDDAVAFIEHALRSGTETMFAIEMDDEIVGGIGFGLHVDVERVSAEIGYWLGEPFWGRGIMTEALPAVTRYAIETHRLTRVYALPFAWNDASFRVLEKAGYVREARLRCSALKEGQIIDQFLYAFVTPERGKMP